MVEGPGTMVDLHTHTHAYTILSSIQLTFYVSVTSVRLKTTNFLLTLLFQFCTFLLYKRYKHHQSFLQRPVLSMLVIKGKQCMVIGLRHFLIAVPVKECS